MTIKQKMRKTVGFHETRPFSTYHKRLRCTFVQRCSRLARNKILSKCIFFTQINIHCISCNIYHYHCIFTCISSQLYLILNKISRLETSQYFSELQLKYVFNVNNFSITFEFCNQEYLQYCVCCNIVHLQSYQKRLMPRLKKFGSCNAFT